MLDFISKTQLDMAGEDAPSAGGETESIMRGLAGSIIPMLHDQENEEISDRKAQGDMEKDFKDLKLLEMMDVLTRKLVKWQKNYS